MRATLTDFSRATAAKDYQALCDKLLAPSLISDLKKIGLPCEIALQQGLGDVRQPRLIVGQVTVKGKTAVAEVRTSAEGEPPSKDTVELQRTDAGWRIASLATPSEPGPAPYPRLHDPRLPELSRGAGSACRGPVPRALCRGDVHRPASTSRPEEPRVFGIARLCSRALVALALLAPGWTPGVRAADAYADARAGTVAFAVRTDRRLWGRDLDRPVQGASVVKALLLVAYLRDPACARDRCGRDERALLSPMVRWSNNRKAADGHQAARGGADRPRGPPRRHAELPPRAGLLLGCTLITAREQTRFFLHIDALVPQRHRAFAMERLRTVVHTQRWGIAEVAPRGWELYFKGGWGSGRGLVDHQVALLQRGRERVAVAILTTVSGTHRDGKVTLRGVARRLLRGLAGS